MKKAPVIFLNIMSVYSTRADKYRFYSSDALYNEMKENNPIVQ